MIYLITYLLGATVMAIIAVSTQMAENFAETEGVHSRGFTVALTVVLALTWPYQLLAMVAAAAATVWRMLK